MSTEITSRKAEEMRLFAGSGNPALAKSIASWLGCELGDVKISRFADGETYVKFEESVRGTDAFVIQPTCPPVDSNLVELLIMIDALRRASARRITAVLPYYGYARQEKKDRPREAITAKLIADIITAAGADRVIALDLHADAIQGFFNIPLDHLTAISIFADYFRHKPVPDLVIVSPDEGRVKKARKLVSLLGAPLAVGYKHHPEHQVTEITDIAGDVRGKAPLIIEDMITTGGSVIEAVNALIDNGAKPEIRVAATHGILARDAVDRMQDHPAIAEIVVTDSVPLPDDKKRSKIKVVSVSPLLAEAIRRVNLDLSVTSLFE
ncbi:MAG: ribose-phosphate pyrophosphokinase [Capsulimonadaceae bacterium]|nr:ribose-phosphate pyrophosphokinase [Capsulimonadaceae bacterium]